VLTLSLLGEVDGRDVVVVDDMVDSAGTLLRTVRLLKRRGAKRVLAYATHGLLSGEALRRITQSPLEEMLVTDSVPLVRRGDSHQRKLAAASCRKISQLSCSPLLAEAMVRMHCCDSLQHLRVYDVDNYDPLRLGEADSGDAEDAEPEEPTALRG